MSQEIIGIKKAVKLNKPERPEQVESQSETSSKTEEKLSRPNPPNRVESPPGTGYSSEKKLFKPMPPNRFSSQEEIVGNSDKKLLSKPQFPKKSPRFEKPKRAASKIEKVPDAANANGEVFKPGDKIIVPSPWSSQEEVEITGFYKGPKGSVFAQFVPKDSLPNWNWEKGCIRAELLKQPSGSN